MFFLYDEMIEGPSMWERLLECLRFRKRKLLVFSETKLEYRITSQF